VVKNNKFPDYPDRLVKVEQVTNTDGGIIHLSCTQDEVANMQPFTTTHYVHKEIPDYADAYIGGGSVSNPLPATPDDSWNDKVKDRHVPKNEMALSHGMTVKTHLGEKVGQVDKLVVDPQKHAVTDILMREGHLWGAKDVVVPITEIQEADDDEIFLKLDKDEIDALPTVPLKK
jgi:sporulation protein YlmC with PRC-barrel domain